MRPIHRVTTAVLLLSLLATAREPIAKSSLEPIKFFAGCWHGNNARGEPGEGKGERNYEFVLRGNFELVIKRSTPNKRRIQRARFTKVSGFSVMTASGRNSCSGSST